MMPPKSCPACHCQFRPRKSVQRFCSMPCALTMRTPPKRKLIGKWGLSVRGYVVRKEWRGDKRIAVLQHRMVAEETLGRKLSPDEDVHHINGIKTDNRPENLMVLKHGQHTTITNSERTYKRGYNIQITPEDAVRRRDQIVRIGRKLKGTKKSEETKERMRAAQKLRREQERSSSNHNTHLLER